MSLYPAERVLEAEMGALPWRHATWYRACTSTEAGAIPPRHPDTVVSITTRRVVDMLPPCYAEDVWALMVRQLRLARQFGHATPGAPVHEDRAQAGAQAIAWLRDELLEGFPHRSDEVAAMCRSELIDSDESQWLACLELLATPTVVWRARARRRLSLTRALVELADYGQTAAADHARLSAPAQWLLQLRDVRLRGRLVEMLGQPDLKGDSCASIDDLYRQMTHTSPVGPWPRPLPTSGEGPGLSGGKPYDRRRSTAARPPTR
jgi:hypothetical protein